MAMEWQRVSLSGSEDTDGVVTVDRHWYLTEDKTRVVPEGDPESRWLWASPGTQVPRRDALRLGALKEEPAPVEEAAVADEPEKAPEPEPETPAEEPAVEEKQAKPAANKAGKKAANKAATNEGDK